MSDQPTQPTVTMDQAIASLLETQGLSAAMKRVICVRNSETELFDAASVVLDWMRTLPPEDRPIAKFNRLADAINGVREAHQMDPEHVR